MQLRAGWRAAGRRAAGLLLGSWLVGSPASGAPGEPIAPGDRPRAPTRVPVQPKPPVSPGPASSTDLQPVPTAAGGIRGLGKCIAVGTRQHVAGPQHAAPRRAPGGGSGSEGEPPDDAGDPPAPALSPAVLEDCKSTPEQTWSFLVNGTIMASTGGCLALDPGSTGESGSAVEVTGCSTSATQIWKFTRVGELRSSTGRCIDIPGANATTGAALRLADCSGVPSQHWDSLVPPCGVDGEQCAAAIEIRFGTLDDGKDHDTKVQVRLGGGMIGGVDLIRDEEYPANSTRSFPLAFRGPVHMSDVMRSSLFLTISTVGRDTWKFDLLLVATLTDGSKLPLIARSHLVLNEDNRSGNWPIASRGLLPYDIADGPLDANALPLDPRWGSQFADVAALPTVVDCRPLLEHEDLDEVDMKLRCSSIFSGTTKPAHWYQNPVYAGLVTFEGVCGARAPGGFNGHVNFVPVTYTGALTFHDHHDWTHSNTHDQIVFPTDPGDDDYTFFLMRPDHAGLTAANKLHGPPDAIALEVEMDASDSIDLFASPWWQEFHRWVDAGDGDGPSAVHPINQLFPPPLGSWAIVTGLLGLDCGEDCKSELHPAYAMTFLSHRQAQTGVEEEEWPMLLRNFGDEGGCGDSTLMMKIERHTFSIPWLPGATDVTVNASEVEAKLWQPFRFVNAATKPAEVVKLPGVSVDVTFTLPGSGARAFLDGRIYVTWSGAAQPRGPAPRQPAGKVSPANTRPSEPRSPERAASSDRAFPVRQAFAALPSEKRTAITRAVKDAVSIDPYQSIGATRVVSAVPQSPVVARAPKQPVNVPFRPIVSVTARKEPSPTKLLRAEALRKALCAEYRNAPPGVEATYCSVRR